MRASQSWLLRNILNLSGHFAIARLYSKELNSQGCLKIILCFSNVPVLLILLSLLHYIYSLSSKFCICTGSFRMYDAFASYLWHSWNVRDPGVRIKALFKIHWLVEFPWDWNSALLHHWPAISFEMVVKRRSQWKQAFFMNIT